MVAPGCTLSGPSFITASDGEAVDEVLNWKVVAKSIPSVVLSAPLIFTVYVPAPVPLITTSVSTGDETGTFNWGI